MTSARMLGNVLGFTALMHASAAFASIVADCQCEHMGSPFDDLCHVRVYEGANFAMPIGEVSIGVESVGLAVIHDHDPRHPVFRMSCPYGVPFSSACGARAQVTAWRGSVAECGFPGGEFACWQVPITEQSPWVPCGSL